MKKLLVRLLVLLAVLAGGFYGWGMRLPEQTHTAVTVELAKPVNEVYATVTNYQDLASWLPDLQSVEARPDDAEGHKVWRMSCKRGDYMDIQVIEDVPNQRHIGRIGETSSPFAGTWTYDFAPNEAGGTKLTLTEDGSCSSPVFRAISAVLGADYMIRDHLDHLAKKLGVEPVYP